LYRELWEDLSLKTSKKDYKKWLQVNATKPNRSSQEVIHEVPLVSKSEVCIAPKFVDAVVSGIMLSPQSVNGISLAALLARLTQHC